MPGKTPAERRALEAVRSTVSRLFEAHGFTQIEPEVLQPADVFLDRSGEDIRSRTYVFTDLSGAELCLRPDLTVPTCRYHLSHQADPRNEARYAYVGPAFRYEPAGNGTTPREFDQAGIEWFGAPDAEVADADVLACAIEALRAAGLSSFTVQTGDLALFEALLDSLAIPDRWRRRLKRQFWRPRAFRLLLDVLTGRAPRPRPSHAPLVKSLAGRDAVAVETAVEEELRARNLDLIGGRSLAEIAGRLAEQAQDLVETPIPERDRTFIDTYLSMRGAPADVTPALQALACEVGGALPAAVARMARRNALIAERLPSLPIEFSTVLGRSLEYYTGFVFQVEAPGPAGPMAVAGGGRYDTMLSDIGSPWPVPSVGCAIHTERLVDAVGDGGMRGSR
jgi:ATP phosphoribosyltransferase regulatory subunit